MLTIDGHCDPRFTAVREQFFRNFTERGDVGAACVTNQYVTGTAKSPDRRVLSLVDAVYAALR